MGDPELMARAHQAAVRLERSWDRWRRMQGLAAEQAQPVSSYVGYSLAEPWGRPRVVFGVGAEEAELLSDLLDRDEGADQPYDQGLLWEPDSAGQPVPMPGYAVNGVQPHGPAARQPGQAGLAGTAEPAPGEWAPDSPVLQQPAPPDMAASPERDDAGSLSADLAGWTSGELPGQVSAGLAARPQARTAPDGADRTARPAPACPDQVAQQAAADPGSAAAESVSGCGSPERADHDRGGFTALPNGEPTATKLSVSRNPGKPIPAFRRPGARRLR